jgi:hypothetical protein
MSVVLLRIGCCVLQMDDSRRLTATNAAARRRLAALAAASFFGDSLARRQAAAEAVEAPACTSAAVPGLGRTAIATARLAFTLIEAADVNIDERGVAV